MMLSLENGAETTAPHLMNWPAIEAHARERFREQDLALTDLRATVLRELWESGTPQGAYGLTRLLNAHLPKPLAPNSIYRVLALLHELRLVRRITSQQTFKVVNPGEREDDVLLLCERCGDCMSAGHARIGDELLELASAHEFAPSNRIVEIVGTCGPCARSLPDSVCRPALRRA